MSSQNHSVTNLLGNPVRNPREYVTTSPHLQLDGRRYPPTAGRPSRGLIPAYKRWDELLKVILGENQTLPDGQTIYVEGLQQIVNRAVQDYLAIVAGDPSKEHSKKMFREMNVALGTIVGTDWLDGSLFLPTKRPCYSAWVGESGLANQTNHGNMHDHVTLCLTKERDDVIHKDHCMSLSAI